MGLAGKAVIAIWQDIVPDAKQEFYNWHDREHVPERLSIPGFRRARRLIAVEGSPEFFTLYETDDAGVAAGKDYLDRLNSPTEWTRRIMPVFRNMARSVCTVVYSGGSGKGDFLMTLRFDHSSGLSDVLPKLLDLQGVTGVHLCVADDSASKVQTFEKTFRTEVDQVPPCVVMVEGTSKQALLAGREILLKSVERTADSAIYATQLSAWSSHKQHQQPQMARRW